MDNIVLTGLSGSGKSTLGKAAADALGMTFIDMDDVAEAQAGMPVRDIFAQHGEPYFRDLESKIAGEVAAMHNMVIATGGGAVLRGENVRILRSTGRIVFLDRPPERIIQDLECGGRPLLRDGAEKLFDMANERRPLYLAAADDILPNAGDEPEALQNLLALLRREKKPSNYVVIGDPISHTLSPPIHNAVFSALGLGDTYSARYVKRGEASAFAAEVRAGEIKGFNVTAPHKPDIIPYLDEVEPEALLCGAVNTVVKQGGKLCGYNTDMQGLLLSIQDCGYDYRDSVIVILGTGGGASGIALKALREGARKIRICGRRPEVAEKIAERLRGLSSATKLTVSDLTDPVLEQAVRDCDILINTIPLGMTGMPEDTRSMAFLRAVPKHALVCDLIYSPPRTAFLRAAQALGLRVLNGLPMLIYQAIIADEYYTGQPLDRQAMYRAVTETLSL